MSSAAERAAARRAKILARGSERMATVTGQAAVSHASSEPQEEQTHTQAAATAAAATLSAADADAALDAALNAMSTGGTAAPAEAAAAPAAGGEEDANASQPIVADPHEFPSSDEVASYREQQQLSLSQQQDSAESDPFQAFAAAAAQAMNAQGSTSYAQSAAALRRRQKDAAAASAATQDLSLPPPRSPLARWVSRVQTQLSETAPSRGAMVGLTLVVAVLSGVGAVEGGLGWLMIVQLLVHTATYLHSALKGSGKRSAAAAAAAAAARRPAPSPPPADANLDDDPDVIELDTDAYTAAARRGAPNAQQGLQTIPGFPFPMFGGGGGNASGGFGGSLSGLGLPPALDTGLQAMSLLLKYGSLMRQLLNDAMLFLFVTVVTNALQQMSWAEKVVYTTQ